MGRTEIVRESRVDKEFWKGLLGSSVTGRGIVRNRNFKRNVCTIRYINAEVKSGFVVQRPLVPGVTYQTNIRDTKDRVTTRVNITNC